jgi:ABC-type uncharacterized transport system substrate-binding protein
MQDGLTRSLPIASDMKRLIRNTLCSATVLFGLLPSSAWAHPHEFVTMQVRVVFNDEGQITKFRYNWVFDEFFSAYAVEGQDKNANGKAEQEETDAVLSEILGNIEKIQYFTKLETEGLAPVIVKAKAVGSTMLDRKLSITYDVPFKSAFDVKGSTLKYAVYDPEFYIAMEHKDAGQGVILENAPKNCSWELGEPTPSEEIEEFASSLGKEDTGTPDLGASFAEWVSITCK